ncbi:hypothetical protein HUU40_27170 [candidate division KSB1 bacterium]|nr:hypothetical protein [candidate division KSB1 bacterium]
METKGAARQIPFEGGLVPSPAVIGDERLLGSVEAKFWDLGLIGFLLRHKERVVITTHRIFQFSRKLTSTELKCLELAKVEFIGIGGRFNWKQFLFGLAIVTGSMSILNELPRSYNDFAFALFFFAAIGIIIMILCRDKVLQVSCGGQNAISLPLRRIKVEESKAFIDLVSSAIRNLGKSMPIKEGGSRTSAQPAEGAFDDERADFSSATIRRRTSFDTLQ